MPAARSAFASFPRCSTVEFAIGASIVMKLSSVIKITLTYLQVTALASQLRVRYGDLMRQMLQLNDSISNIGGSDVAILGCTMPLGTYVQ